MDKRISIIIPTYNNEQQLERCLRSVMAQTYKNLEIIVINDGSTDGTATILDRLAKEDKRIIAIHKTNTGVSDTRNRGLEMATGDYIGFVDADDEVLPGMYAHLMVLITEHHADIAHCGFELVDPTQTTKFYGTGEKLLQNRNQALTSLLRADRFEPGIWNKLFSRKTIDTVRFSKDIKINEDLLFNVEAFHRADTLVFQDVILYRYLHNADSASRSGFNASKLRDVTEAAERIRAKFKDGELKPEVNRFYAGKLTDVYMTILNQENTKELRKEIRKKLAQTSNFGLSFRNLYLKYSLLYFLPVYRLSRLVYDKTLGKNKKWA